MRLGWRSASTSTTGGGARRRWSRFGAVGVAGVVCLALAGSASAVVTADGAGDEAGPLATSEPDLIPQPVSYQSVAGQTFELTLGSRIVVKPATRANRAVATTFAERLRRSTGFALPVSSRRPHGHDIVLRTTGAAALGSEGYHLRAGSQGVAVVAHTPEGLFRALTTLRQMLPAEVEATSRQNGPWQVAGAVVTDRPRFGYRGAHLDVSRHFFSVDEVKRYIDLVSLYKINRLHLHLSDDQGWRITVDSWPRLTEHGGSTEVGGGPGGYYTKADYAELVDYAAEHYIEIVPEIDTPGHTNAALASYAELNCDGVARELYTGTEVGFSSLCTTKEITYDFLDDVFGEVAAQSPGPMLHLGGDEAHSTPHEEYLDFVPRASALVTGHGKRVMGWQEIAETPLPPGSIAQYWGTDDARSQNLARQAVAQDAKLVLSPANRVYLDMKYDPSTPYGLSWAGFVPVRKAYDWDPDTLIPGVREPDIAGVEAPLWSETLDEIGKAEFMAFPRLPGVAEIGWSPASARSWEEYRHRLGGQAPRWEVLDVNYFAAPEIPWQ
jgi:hexosaminidase